MFFKKSRAELFDCGLANDMSNLGHTCVGEYHFNTMFLFCSVQFALDHLKINFVWLCQRLVSLPFKKTTVHINLLEYFFFLEIDVCIISLLTLFVICHIPAPQDSNIDSHA